MSWQSVLATMARRRGRPVIAATSPNQEPGPPMNRQGGVDAGARGVLTCMCPSTTPNRPLALSPTS